ncbi:MAG TPA: TonB-dependent receptor [Pyrinomonadaceae bacterium]|nr:TonB-dependent receptor [Pyrinomonadaceae bacterium]
MKKIFLLTTVLLSLAVSGFAQANGSVTGTVRLANEDTVIHGATVKITELKVTSVTADDGTYTFKNVPAGHYTLVAHQEGFKDSSQSVDVTAGAPVTADFKMTIAGVSEQVTVTAGGSEVLAGEAMSAVNVVDSSQITLRAAVGLGDILNNEAGVAKRSAGVGDSRPVIRGFDGDRVKIAADGVSVGSLGSQSGDHAEPVDTLAVERIEVVKGPATLLYGSNAIGGVVNAISGHDEGSHPGFRAYASGIGGTNNGQAAAAGGVEYGKANWMLWSNLSAQRTGDYKAGGDFGTVRNTFANNATGQTGFGYFGHKAFFTTNFNYYQSRYGVPFDFFDPSSPLRSIKMHRGDLKFNFGLTNLDAFATSAKFTVDLSRYQHQELEDGVVGTTFRNYVDSVRGMFEQRKHGSFTGRFGFETFGRDFSTIGEETLVDGPVKQKMFSTFGLEEWTRDRVTLTFGGRIEHNGYDPKNTALIDRSFTGFSVAAGAKFNLWKGGLFVANYSHGFRAPALEELYNNGPHDGSLLFEVGNPHLKPEVNNGLDLSLRHQAGRLKTEANFYYYKFLNFVFLAPRGVIDPGSGLEFADYLQGDARYIGTELSADVTANRYLNVITAFDYVNAQLNDGRPLPRISPARGRVGLDFHYKDMSVKPEFVAVARQDRIFTNETPTAGYGTFNISGSYVIGGKHTAQIFSVNAYNLNNKLYYNHISFIKEISPEIGRGIRFTYTIRYF